MTYCYIYLYTGGVQMKKIDKAMFKMSKEELEKYMQMQRKASVIQGKRGKGSYKRKKIGDSDFE